MNRTRFLVAFAVIALVGSAGLAPSAVAGDFETNELWCIDETQNPDLRIGACTWLLRSGQLSPEEVPDVFTMRGNARRDKEKLDEALEDYSTALRTKSDHQGALHNRGTIWRLKGEYERAIRDFTAALNVEPDSPESHFWRGDIRARRGEYDQAIEDYTTALRIKPLYRQALTGLAWLRATAPEERLRDGLMAVKLAEKAISLKDTAAIRDTLAAAYAQAGRFAEAVGLQERAVAKARTEGLSAEDIAEFEARLRFYRKRQPYREGPPSTSAPRRGT